MALQAVGGKKQLSAILRSGARASRCTLVENTVEGSSASLASTSSSNSLAAMWSPNQSLSQLTPVKPVLLGHGNMESPTREASVKFIEPPDRKFICVVCARVLRYPVLFDECRHRSCSSCLSGLLR
ncbi:unnamed protein product [Protopolystoma xenopodis]|uniref:Zinc finger C3HC4 RING-type domain-containing protein n=1 Tax=Protopolystoma xenopodis TaxID=117903 RepID=A0A3S5CCI1_9PLAT|nr:unnamed protein product [Protopolystoma xenopodis]